MYLDPPGLRSVNPLSFYEVIRWKVTYSRLLIAGHFPKYFRGWRKKHNSNAEKGYFWLGICHQALVLYIPQYELWHPGIGMGS